MRKLSIYLIFLLYSIACYAGAVKGIVKDDSGEPVPYASVYIKNSTYGVATNTRGEYFLELKPGRYRLVFSCLGYETQEHDIVIPGTHSAILNVIMVPSSMLMKEVEIVADKRDRARDIMNHVRDMRKIYLDSIEAYQCQTYIKTSIEKEPANPEKTDSLETDTTEARDIKKHFKKEKLNLLESISKTNFKSPGKYKEEIIAHHDYAETRGEGSGREVSMTLEYGEENIVPESNFEDNPYILYKDVANGDFNFYKNLIDFPTIVQKPILSPIATGSALNYTYKYIETFYEGDKKIHKLEVKPLFKTEPLFSGILYIEDSTWAISAVDLSIDRDAIQFCRDFRIIQNYEMIDGKYSVPVRREIIYTIRDGKYNILGNTRVDHSEYKINPEFPDRFFNNAIKTFDIYAFDKDSAFWNEQRPITLKDNELEFIQETDSIKAYYISEEYYHKIDSAFNRISWWFWLTGVGHRCRPKGTEWYIGGFFEQINPVGIGGYRHKLPGYFNKEFKNGMLLENKGFIDYGFRNEDVKGKLSVGLTYIPLKFVRTMITAGEFYEMINNYASFEQVFSRSNYARTRTLGVAQRMELVNGLFGELSVEYSDQIAINNMQLSTWSKYVFGNLNEPVEFEPYTKFEVRLEMKYRFNQKYIIRGNKKYIIGTDFPEARFIYRKGIPGVFNSEVDFDYIEFGMSDDMQLARFGTTRWEAQMGTFANRNNLRLLENKYFRGSDHWYFSDPVKSFQLLGPTLNTRDEYFRANFIHHFEGAIMNRVPLFSRLQLSLAGGAGILAIQDQNFRHVEMYAGIEKMFRIKKQLFRFSVFAVTADNTLEKADFTFKFGIGFFNTYTNKWEY